MFDKDFYRKFEEKHYASRSYIKMLRQDSYMRFIKPLKKIYPQANTFDFGCGRGEWLELMQEIGYKPFGVDMDAGMLQGAIEHKLPVAEGNAIDYIKQLETESQCVVTAFQVIEHIHSDDLQTFISEAYRVLKPYGLLIMETPNPENIQVGICNFYMDFTHIRPIPPKLLSFCTEYVGFIRNKILYLHESTELLSSPEHTTLLDIYKGASLDYAVIAQKPGGEKDKLGLFDDCFAKNYGLPIEELLFRYDSGRAGNELQKKVSKIPGNRSLIYRIARKIYRAIRIIINKIKLLFV